MSIFNPRQALEGLLSLGSIGVLAAGIAAIDDTARGWFIGVLSADPSTELALAGGNLQRAAHMVMATAGEYTTTQTPIVLFVVAGGALLLLMLRS